MASVQLRARNSKSTATKQHPTRDTAGWLADPASYAAVRTLAKQYRGLACCDTDDLTQDIVVAALEAKTAPKDDGEFAAWLDALARAVAGGLRDEFLSQPRAVDSEVLQAVVEDPDGGDEPPFTHAAEMKRFLDNRRSRIRRALGKLSAQHREVIESRFFRGANLAAEAGADGGCDSRDRMRLLRAKAKLQSLIGANGYALAA